MVRDNQDAFTKIMEGLAAVFDKPLTPTFQALYFGALADIRIEALKYAAREAVKNCRFFPRPAELREISRNAPRPAMPPAAERVLLPETPPSMAIERLREISAQLNAKFGDSRGGKKYDLTRGLNAGETENGKGAAISGVGSVPSLPDMPGAEGSSPP